MSRERFLKRRVRAIQHDGETYHVRPLTGTQIEALIAKEGDEALDGIKALSRVCCYCACDESGARLWSDGDLEQIRNEADFAVVRAVAEAALKLSGLSDDPGNA